MIEKPLDSGSGDFFGTERLGKSSGSLWKDWGMKRLLKNENRTLKK